MSGSCRSELNQALLGNARPLGRRRPDCVLTAELHREALSFELFGGVAITAQRTLNGRPLFNSFIVMGEVRVFRAVEAGARHSKPDPVDVGVHDRPAVTIPPLAFRKTPVNKREVRPHCELSHFKDAEFSPGYVAEVLRDPQPGNDWM